MTAFNVVRFGVKPGRESDFIAAPEAHPDCAGFRRFVLIKASTGLLCHRRGSDQRIITARPSRIAMFATFGYTLEDLGAGLRVTDPVSGEVVVEM